MPLSDQALELVFSILLKEKGEKELRLVARPACRLLQARRMRGFDHVALRVCRMGLEWAMKERAFFEKKNMQSLPSGAASPAAEDAEG